MGKIIPCGAWPKCRIRSLSLMGDISFYVKSSARFFAFSFGAALVLTALGFRRDQADVRGQQSLSTFAHKALTALRSGDANRIRQYVGDSLVVGGVVSADGEYFRAKGSPAGLFPSDSFDSANSAKLGEEFYIYRTVTIPFGKMTARPSKAILSKLGKLAQTVREDWIEIGPNLKSPHASMLSGPALQVKLASDSDLRLEFRPLGRSWQLSSIYVSSR